MAKLQIATDRYVYQKIQVSSSDSCYRSAAGVLESDAKGRDIKIGSYTLSFHGRLLIENAEIALNYGQRYGLLGENGSGKVCTIRNLIAAWNTNSSLSPHFFSLSPNAIYRYQTTSISTSSVAKPSPQT